MRFFLFLLLTSLAFADTLPNGKIKGATDGTLIGNVGDALKTTGSVSGNVTVIQTTGTNLHTVVDSSALPTGAATSALQTTGNASLSSILAQLDVALSTRASQATIASILAQLDVATSTRASEATLALVKAKTDNLDVLLSTRATSALQTTGNASLASIDTKLTAPLPVTGPLTDAQLRATPVPVSGTVTANIGTTNGLALDSTVAKDASLSTINTSINTLLKPANTLAAVTTLGSITSALPTGANTIGKVTITQGGNDATVNSNGSITVAGVSAVGSAPVNPPIAVSGIDGGGLKRHILTDTSGRVVTDTADGSGNLITSTSINSKVGISSQVTGSDPLTVSGSGSALNATPIPDTAVSGYRCLSLQRILSGTNTITVEQSNDDTNWVNVQCSNETNATAAPVSTLAASGMLYCPIHGARVRTRISAFTSGSSTETASFSPFACDSLAGKNVSNTVTVTGTVNTNPATATFSTQLASAARTTSGNSGNITQGAPNTSAVFEVNVTAVSGTTPTLDLVFQESYDNGTTWTDMWHWERITATGQFSTPFLAIKTSHFRFVWTIGGTTPSFTFSIGGTQGNHFGQIVHRFIDRTIDPNTLNSTSAAFDVSNCMRHNFTINIAACATFPTFTLELSEDGTNYATTTNALAITANGTALSASLNEMSKFVRLKTTVVGTTCTLGYASLRCSQY